MQSTQTLSAPGSVVKEMGERAILGTHRSVQGPVWPLAQEPGSLHSQDLNDPWLQGFELQET